MGVGTENGVFTFVVCLVGSHSPSFVSSVCKISDAFAWDLGMAVCDGKSRDVSVLHWGVWGLLFSREWFAEIGGYKGTRLIRILPLLQSPTRAESLCVCVCVCADAATTTKLTSFDIDFTRVARSFANCGGRKGGLPPMDACA